MDAIVTIGYEQASLDAFISTLQRAGVTTLLDVRELPVSRRKGFSKRSLSDALAAAGIAYRHERALGSPRDIRHQLHADGDYADFFRQFSTYLREQQPLLKELATELAGTVALMCFERDPATCHRSVVAKELEALTRLKTKHLGVHDVPAHSRASLGARQSVSPA